MPSLSISRIKFFVLSEIKHEKLAQKILDEVIFKELKESKETDGDTKKFLTENNVERIKLMIYPKNYVRNQILDRLILFY